ncbi:MAG: hypothetical protein AB1641_12380 [Thermodesulfobacteriota bacterium]
MNMKHGLTRLLICRSSAPYQPGVQRGFSLVNSPAACINEATSRSYDLAVIYVEPHSLKERSAWVNLAMFLKKNPHTRTIKVLVLIEAWHRRLVEDLAEAGVDYVDLIDPARDLEPEAIRKRSDLLGPSNETAVVLGRLCPFLNHTPIGEKHELTTCLAYRDRLVLGRYLLDNYCHLGRYEECEYYLAPKFKPRPRSLEVEPGALESRGPGREHVPGSEPGDQVRGEEGPDFAPLQGANFKRSGSPDKAMRAQAMK